jgi:hypothetical protein
VAQQPNVEITEATRPRQALEPGPAKKWRSAKPGIPAGPADVPQGAHFGHAGPDPGWALRLVAKADLPSDDPRLESVVTGLVMARASASGRAPVPEDIEVALFLCGYGEDAQPELIERREKWLAAVPHEKRPGEAAVADVDRELIVNKMEQIRYAYRLSDTG